MNITSTGTRLTARGNPLSHAPTHTQNKQGEIKHVYRGNVFIQARNIMENGGIIVCKAKHVELAGGTSNAVRD